MAEPTIFYDFEFHFLGGTVECVTVEIPRDRQPAADDQRVRLERHPAPGVTEEIIVQRAGLAMLRTTKREEQPATQLERDLHLVGGAKPS